MKITTLEVAGLESAIKGMRLPMMSRDRSDSFMCDYRMCNPDCCNKCEPFYNCIFRNDKPHFVIGENDMDLCKRLVKAGSEHAKFLRMIQVWADVDMPRYMWQELDCYKFGVKNSESTMHRLLNNQKPISLDMFVYCVEDEKLMKHIIEHLDRLRIKYLECKENQDYRNYLLLRAKRLLPEGFLQMRTWNTNYAELRNIYHQRKNHRLKEEWQDVFIGWIKTLPYVKELIIGE